jgi:Plavaka transposase
MAIGNIPKALRQKPTQCAQILIAYLLTTKLKHITNKAACQRTIANLFHSCMRRILSPLERAGVEGLLMSSGNGVTRHMHLILASFTGDYPEQLLVTGVKNGECPKCDVPH